MADSESSNTELPGPATEAFSVLSNETRLLTVLALWEAYDPFAEDNALPFSELYDHVDVDDTGNFNYHLNKLSGDFITQTDSGYELSDAGLSLVQAVVAGSSIRSPEYEPTETDESCPHCGASVEVAYPGQGVWVTCTDCEGWFDGSSRPDGLIMGFEFPPAGLDGRSLDEVLHAMVISQLNKVESMLDGVCTTCGGRIEMHLDLCEDHDVSEGLCDTCGVRFQALAKLACTTCKTAVRGPSWAPVVSHPAVIAFFYDHGIEHVHASWDAMERADNCQEELTSMDPVRMAFTFTADGDELTLTVDETLSVVDIDE